MITSDNTCILKIDLTRNLIYVKMVLRVKNTKVFRLHELIMSIIGNEIKPNAARLRPSLKVMCV